VGIEPATYWFQVQHLTAVPPVTFRMLPVMCVSAAASFTMLSYLSAMLFIVYSPADVYCIYILLPLFSMLLIVGLIVVLLHVPLFISPTTCSIVSRLVQLKSHCMGSQSGQKWQVFIALLNRHNRLVRCVTQRQKYVVFFNEQRKSLLCLWKRDKHLSCLLWLTVDCRCNVVWVLVITSSCAVVLDAKFYSSWTDVFWRFIHTDQ